MENYHEVNDRKILGYIWSRLKYLRLDGWLITLEVAVLKFILNFIKVENSTNSGQSAYNYDVYHKLIDLAKSLEMSFTEIVLGSWKDIDLYLPSSKVSYLVDLMRKYIPSNWSMSDAMVEAILDFFSDQFSHGVNSCLLLKLFPRGDVNLTKAYSIISENSAFYSSGALLQVAYEHSEMSKSEQSIEYLPAGHVFSEYAERAIICALKKKDKHISDSAPRRGKGRIFPLENPDSNIQWVFRAFLDKPARAVVKSQQFKDITSLVAEAYNDDIKTILSLFECVKSHKIILDKCKLLLGLSIVGLVTAHTHDALKLIKHVYYKEFLAELERVQEYFCAYVVGGEKAFKNLLKEIKLKYKTKAKLLDNIKRKFTTS